MANNDEIVIKVSGVNKSFKLPHEKNTSVKSIFVNPFKKRTFEKQEVLKNIDFEIKKGEFFGIVGRNGSGKSTLLKLLAGIYSPDKGHIQINGKLTPFIELGVGFNPELTGRENVYLNGALLGFNRKEMNEMYDEIVDFAELEKFMDQKLKNYSSGMQVRLAFSIAIRAKSDILLIDEVLAVGDSSFQRKCYEIFTTLKSEGRTIVFVTHDMSAVERFCDKALVLKNGLSEGIFKPSDASAIYNEMNASTESTSTIHKKVPKRWGTGKVKLENLSFYSNGEKLKRPVFNMGEDLEFRITTSSNTKTNIVIGLAFEDVFGVNVAGPNSKESNLISDDVNVFKVSKNSLLPGEYKLTVAIYDKDLVEEFDHHERAFTIRVRASSNNTFGKFNLFPEWHKIRSKNE